MITDLFQVVSRPSLTLFDLCQDAAVQTAPNKRDCATVADGFRGVPFVTEHFALNVLKTGICWQ